jgi:PAS domain S-box-containing protein
MGPRRRRDGDRPALLSVRHGAGAPPDMSDIDQAIARLSAALALQAEGKPASPSVVAAAREALSRLAAARRAERDALAESEERLRLAVEGARTGTWDHDPATGRLLWDARQRDLFGVPATGEVDDALFDSLLHPDDREAVRDAVARAMSGGGDGSYDVEYRIRRPDGVERWLRGRGRVFHRGASPSRRAFRFIGTTVDVTARKTVETTMAERLAEREAMLREIHHRVRNNLQVVWSLLRLEASRTAARPFRARLERLAERISTLGAVHGRIAEAEALRLGGVDFVVYLDRRIPLMAERHGLAPSAYAFRSSPLACGLDAAVPLALLADELIDDAFRRAGPGGRVGVALRRSAGGAAALLVRLAGAHPSVGAEEDGLRLDLVNALAQQIGGRFDILRRRDTVLRLRVPADVLRPVPPA